LHRTGPKRVIKVLSPILGGDNDRKQRFFVFANHNYLM
jgi:hypothetical protein